MRRDGPRDAAGNILDRTAIEDLPEQKPYERGERVLVKGAVRFPSRFIGGIIWGVGEVIGIGGWTFRSNKLKNSGAFLKDVGHELQKPGLANWVGPIAEFFVAVYACTIVAGAINMAVNPDSANSLPERTPTAQVRPPENTPYPPLNLSGGYGSSNPEPVFATGNISGTENAILLNGKPLIVLRNDGQPFPVAYTTVFDENGNGVLISEKTIKAVTHQTNTSLGLELTTGYSASLQRTAAGSYTWTVVK